MRIRTEGAAAVVCAEALIERVSVARVASVRERTCPLRMFIDLPEL